MSVPAVAEATVGGAGRLAGMLLVAVAVGQVMILVARKLGFATVGAQEAVMALAVPAVLLAIPWTLRLDRHVAVDAFARTDPWRRRTRRIGAIFALLVGGVFLWLSLPYAWSSFVAGEGSYELSGFDLRWAAKATLPLFALLLTMQATVALLRR